MERTDFVSVSWQNVVLESQSVQLPITNGTYSGSNRYKRIKRWDFQTAVIGCTLPGCTNPVFDPAKCIRIISGQTTHNVRNGSLQGNLNLSI
ncbi:MAG: hypothetical protein NW226_27190 [Microscillaceae bacterium]|nr:hypothetical protein [Microscillaceae bacterium]